MWSTLHVSSDEGRTPCSGTSLWIPAGSRRASWGARISENRRLYTNIPQILLLYKTWAYYNKFDSTKSFGVCYWCFQIPQCGYMGHGLKLITFYIQKHIAGLEMCHNLPLAHDKPLGVPASVKLAYRNNFCIENEDPFILCSQWYVFWWHNINIFVSVKKHHVAVKCYNILHRFRGGEYWANFLRSGIFLNFQHCQNTR